MQVNRELSEECGLFLKRKDEWMCEIEKQLQELEVDKILVKLCCRFKLACILYFIEWKF